MKNRNASSGKCKNNLHITFSLFFIILFLIIIFIFLSSQSADAGTPMGFATDEAPSVINESSEPIVMLNITIWDIDSPTLLSINVTIQNLSTFQPDTDLASLSGDSLSGVMIYSETNGQPDFQFDDEPVGITPTPWMGVGPGKWQTTFNNINQVLPPNINFYYVVCRSSSSISDDELFMMGIMQNDVITDHGKIPQAGDNWSSPVNVDTQDPVPIVKLSGKDPFIGIGDWLNITASFQDTDITTVTVDLSDFNGLSDTEIMVQVTDSDTWFYNLTNILEDGVDTGGAGYPFTVTATDEAKNRGSGVNSTFRVDTSTPSVFVIVKQEFIPAGIGQWINITVVTHVDAVIVEGDLSAFIGLSTFEAFTGSGSSWYYNFTVSEGTLDGSGPIHVIVTDDAGYQSFNDTEQAFVDEIPPTLGVVIVQSSTPAGIGDWINITVTTDSDAVYATVDLDAAGISGQSDDQPFKQIGAITWYYNFTIVAGITDASTGVPININVEDDVQNLNFTLGNVKFDEVYPEPISVNVITQAGGSNPSKIGDWINLTVDAGVHTDITSMVVDAPGIFTSEPVTESMGNIWFLNTTISEGTIDEEITFTVTMIDDAGNTAFTSNYTWIDNQPPSIVEIISVSDATHITPDTVFEGLLTISTQTDSSDIHKVSFYDGDPGSAGVWLGDDFNSSYSMNWQTTINHDGSHVLFARAYDDAGNFKDSSGFSITIKNFDEQPVSIIEWNNRVSLVNLTFILTGETQNSVQWEVFEDNILFIQGNIIRSDNNVDTEKIDLHMDLSRDYEIRLSQSSSNIGSNSMAVTFETKGFVYTVFHVFDSEDPASHDYSIALADILDIMGVVTFDGTGSVDPDGTLVDYAWYIDAELAGSEERLTYQFSENRNYEIILEVTSDDDQTNQTTTNLFIENYKKGAGREELISNEEALSYLRDAKLNAVIFDGEDANLIVYDEKAHPMGVIDGNLVNEIPEAAIIAVLGSTNIYLIPNSSDVTCEVTGGDSSTYSICMLSTLEDHYKMSSVFSNLNQSGRDTYNFNRDLNTFSIVTDRQQILYSLTLTNKTQDSEITFGLTDMEISSGVNHKYDVIDWEGIEDEEGAVRLKIDEDGDGTADAQVELKNGWTGSDVKNAILIKPGEPSVGLPLEFILLLGFVVALGAGSLVFFLTEVGQFSFFYFFYLLYTRIKKEYVLDNFTRGQIFGYIKAHPGVHFSAIKRALELKNGSLAYHIRALEKRGFVTSKRDRGYKRFYPMTMKLPEKNIRELIPIQRSIVDIVKDNPGISQTSIAKRLDISFQLVHYHVKILMEGDYLHIEKDGKQTYCYDADTFKQRREAT
jgi:predicted transcriptional regulator